MVMRELAGKGAFNTIGRAVNAAQVPATGTYRTADGRQTMHLNAGDWVDEATAKRFGIIAEDQRDAKTMPQSSAEENKALPGPPPSRLGPGTPRKSTRPPAAKTTPAPTSE